MSESTIAVIVPVFNEADVLRENLQRFIDLNADELIFVDGGSTDETSNILSESGVPWITSNLGRAAQMNAGAKWRMSDILVFIHVDTSISESNILLIGESFLQPDIVGGRFDVRLSGQHIAFRMIEWMINLRSRYTKISTGDQAMFVSRDVFESMGGFAELPLLEDVEFSKRLKKVGRIACLRERIVTSSRRWEQHGIVETVWLMWKIRLLYWLGVSPEKLCKLYRKAF